MRPSSLLAVWVLVVALASTAAAQTPFAAATSRTLYVPTSASIHGAAGTFFHTDLWAFNRSFAGSITVTATYRCFSGPCSSSVKSFTLASRESRQISDVVATLFQLPETAGAIELSYQSGSDDLAATTRTYTPSIPAPTNGTSIPALAFAEARSRAVFVGLANNGGNLSSGFRTNAGAFFPAPSTGFWTTVTYALYRADGSLLGTTTRNLYGSGALAGQVNDLFDAVGAGSVVTTSAVLVVTSTYQVFPFVTVIDNQSGDSVYLPPVDDRPPLPATALVTNGGFDTGISSWTPAGPTYISLTPAAADAEGKPGSGSLLVSNTYTSSGGSGAQQCLAVTGGDFLNLSARVYIPSDQTATGLANLGLYLDAGTGCTGLYLTTCGTVTTALVDQWVTLSGTCSVPSNAKSGQLVAYTSKAQGTGGFLVYFDDVSVTKSPR